MPQESHRSRVGPPLLAWRRHTMATEGSSRTYTKGGSRANSRETVLSEAYYEDANIPIGSSFIVWTVRASEGEHAVGIFEELEHWST